MKLVASPDRRDPLAKNLTQPVNLGAHGRHATGGRLCPELVEQPIGGHLLVGMQEQEGEQRTLAGTPETERPSSARNLDSAQDPEFHSASKRGDRNTRL